MLGIAEVATFIFGLVALFRGKYSFFGDRVVEGQNARVVGVILMLPITLGFCAGAYLGSTATGGVSPDLVANLSCLELLGWLASILVTIVVGLSESPVQPVVFSQQDVQDSAGIQARRDLLTVEEAATYLHRPESEVLELIESGKLRALKLTTGYRIGQWELKDFLKPERNVTMLP